MGKEYICENLAEILAGFQSGLTKKLEIQKLMIENPNLNVNLAIITELEIIRAIFDNLNNELDNLIGKIFDMKAVEELRKINNDHAKEDLKNFIEQLRKDNGE